MATSIRRVILNYAKKKKRTSIWASVDSFRLKYIEDFIEEVRIKLGISSSKHIELYVKECLLPANETVAILRDDDVVTVKTSRHRNRNPTFVDIVPDELEFESAIGTDTRAICDSGTAAAFEVKKSRKRKHKDCEKEDSTLTPLQPYLKGSQVDISYSSAVANGETDKKECTFAGDEERAANEYVENANKRIEKDMPHQNTDPGAPQSKDGDGVGKCETKKKRRRKRKRKTTMNIQQKEEAHTASLEPNHNPNSEPVSIPLKGVHPLPNKHIIFDDDHKPKASEESEGTSSEMEQESGPLPTNSSTINCDRTEISSGSTEANLSTPCLQPSLPSVKMTTSTPKPPVPNPIRLQRSSTLTSNDIGKKGKCNYASNSVRTMSTHATVESHQSPLKWETLIKPSCEVSDYNAFPMLSGPPRVGDSIAYKLLHLSENYTPEISPYKTGLVKAIDSVTGMMQIELDVPEEVKPREGKFEITNSEEVPEAVTMKKVVEVDWSLMIEPRLLHTR